MARHQCSVVLSWIVATLVATVVNLRLEYFKFSIKHVSRDQARDAELDAAETSPERAGQSHRA